jgi:hypothetical protein
MPYGLQAPFCVYKWTTHFIKRANGLRHRPRYLHRTPDRTPGRCAYVAPFVPRARRPSAPGRRRPAVRRERRRCYAKTECETTVQVSVAEWNIPLRGTGRRLGGRDSPTNRIKANLAERCGVRRHSPTRKHPEGARRREAPTHEGGPSFFQK